MCQCQNEAQEAKKLGEDQKVNFNLSTQTN